MKQSLYKIGDKVIFFKKTDKNDAWELKKFEEYKITCVSKNLVANKDYSIVGFYYGVKHKNGSESTWYLENDLISITEYRKLKLNKIKQINENR
jgi:hypothetical protein